MTQYLSPETYQALKKELEELTTKKRKEIAAKLQEARELGDLSENAAYQEAKREQSEVENRILEIKELLRKASIIKKPKSNDGVIRIGSTFVALSLQDKTKRTFTISGSLETNPAKGIISNESPLGQAFLGHKKGDIIIVKTPKGEVKYKVLKVS